MVRRRSDLLLAGAGLLVLALSALPVDAYKISGIEREIFQLVNSHTLLPYSLVWIGMQAGNLVAVPIAAVAALIARRPRLGAGLFLAGVMVWLLAKVVKRNIERGRPHSILEDAVVRGPRTDGLGFVSGHAAVITALVVVAWPWLGRRARIAGAFLVGFVCFARMYVGAHLPLDMLGGAALGFAVACVVRFALARPA
jgi:undecaprenyl-diphosphatase